MSLAQESLTSHKSQLWWFRTILGGYKNDSEDHVLAVVLCMVLNVENIRWNATQTWASIQIPTWTSIGTDGWLGSSTDVQQASKC
jgi:hypothetical protein